MKTLSTLVLAVLALALLAGCQQPAPDAQTPDTPGKSSGTGEGTGGTQTPENK